MRYILAALTVSILLSCSQHKSPATIIAELNASDTFLIDDPPLSKDPKIELRRNAY